METRHIRFDYVQGLNGKKQVLSSEMNLIYMSKILLRYKRLRKKEFTLKNKLKKSITSLKTKLNTLSSTLPVPEKLPIMHKATKREKTKQEKNLSEELKDIQAKLEKLQ